MPEPQEDGGTKPEKPSKILEFFNRKVKDTKKEQPFTRIVIRRLPPRLTKEELLNQITLPENDSFYFVRGDLAMGSQSFSRAYVNFLNHEEIFDFKEKYDDLLFLDEQGKEYHAVVEWAPVQRLPKKGSQQKVTNSGTLESDPKYIEFLERLEKDKNNAGNPSEYFMETDNIPLKEVKVTTTPLLEFLKLKRDIRNENKLRKKEVEKERRRKEDEARRLEKIKKVKEREKKKLDGEEKSVKFDEAKGEDKDDVSKERDEYKNSVSDSKDRKLDSKSPRPIRIVRPDFKPAARRDEKHDKSPKAFGKAEAKQSKPVEKTIDSGNVKHNKETFEDRKNNKQSQTDRKTNPTSKIDDSSIKPFITKPLEDKKKNQEPEKKEETKSKFRYSEQRNRDRVVRNQKTVLKENIDSVKQETPAAISDRKKVTFELDEETKPRISRQSTQETSDGSVDGDEVKSGEGKKTSSGRKDPRTERRIRNKDRPSIEIYRPGMGKFSKQRLEQKKDDSDSADVRKDDKVDTEYKKNNGKPNKERKKDDHRNGKHQKIDDIVTTETCLSTENDLEEEKVEMNTEDIMEENMKEKNVHLTDLNDTVESAANEASTNESKSSDTTISVEDKPKTEVGMGENQVNTIEMTQNDEENVVEHKCDTESLLNDKEEISSVLLTESEEIFGKIGENKSKLVDDNVISLKDAEEVCSEVQN